MSLDSSESNVAAMQFDFGAYASRKSLVHALTCFATSCSESDCLGCKQQLLHSISCTHQPNEQLSQTNCPHDPQCNLRKKQLATALVSKVHAHHNKQGQQTEESIDGPLAGIVISDDSMLPGDQESRESVARFGRWILTGLASALSYGHSDNPNEGKESTIASLKEAADAVKKVVGDRDPAALWIHMLGCPFTPSPSIQELCKLDLCRCAKKVLIHRLTCKDQGCWLCLSMCLSPPLPASSSNANNTPNDNVHGDGSPPRPSSESPQEP